MTKKSVFSIVIVAGLLAVATAAFAFGPGNNSGYNRMGRGGGYGGQMMDGEGYGMGWNGGAVDRKFWDETADLRNSMYQKHLALNNVLTAPEVDEAQARALQNELNTLQAEMAQKRLAASLEFRKNNPDLNTARGSGYGMGYGSGSCWR